MGSQKACELTHDAPACALPSTSSEKKFCLPETTFTAICQNETPPALTPAMEAQAKTRMPEARAGTTLEGMANVLVAPDTIGNGPRMARGSRSGSTDTQGVIRSMVTRIPESRNLAIGARMR